MFKIIHFADILLDAPLLFRDSDKANIARTEQREALENLLSRAERENAEIVLISGGLFDRRYITRKTAYYIKSIFEKHRSLKIFIMPGAADHYTADSIYSVFSLGENVHVFDSEEITKVSFTSKDGTKADIYGAASFSEKLSLAKFENFKTELSRESDTVNVIMAPKTGDSYAVSTLMETGADVIAFSCGGKSIGVVDDDGCLISDPGALVPVCFDGQEKHGYSLIACSKDHGDLICESEFVPFAKREYVSLEADISGAYDGEDVIEAVKERIGSCGYINNNIVKVRIVGITAEETVLPLDEIAGLVSEAGAYDVIVSDETAPIAEYESRASDQTLKGAFMSELGADIFGSVEEKRKAALSALKIGLDAIDGKDLLENAEK